METENLSSEANLSEPSATIVNPDATQTEPAAGVEATATDTPTVTEPKPSYVKLAMRNMVRKRGLSLQHFFLTTVALLAVFVGLAYLTR
ncbi:MAG: DUF3285 domain-containing protein [Stenomitos frigidus ULC029]